MTIYSSATEEAASACIMQYPGRASCGLSLRHTRRKWKERFLTQFKAGGPRSLTREQDLKTLRGLKLHAYTKATKAAHPAPLQREEEDTDSGGEG